MAGSSAALSIEYEEDLSSLFRHIVAGTGCFLYPTVYVGSCPTKLVEWIGLMGCRYDRLSNCDYFITTDV
jgi:hypothetical protein